MILDRLDATTALDAVRVVRHLRCSVPPTLRGALTSQTFEDEVGHLYDTIRRFDQHLAEKPWEASCEACGSAKLRLLQRGSYECVECNIQHVGAHLVTEDTSSEHDHLAGNNPVWSSWKMYNHDHRPSWVDVLEVKDQQTGSSGTKVKSIESLNLPVKELGILHDGTGYQNAAPVAKVEIFGSKARAGGGGGRCIVHFAFRLSRHDQACKRCRRVSFAMPLQT